MGPTASDLLRRCEIDRVAVTHGPTRIVVRGELDMASSGLLRALLDELHAKRHPVVVDLRGVSFLESTAVCALMHATGAARKDGWQLEMLAPTGFPLRVLEYCEVDEMLPFVTAG